MSKMIALVHESANNSRGLGLNAQDTQALSTEIDALTAKPAPARKLRKYKGIIYFNGAFRCDWELNGAFNAVTACSHFLTDATDEDHAALIALRDNPYEKEQTLEEVLHQTFTDCPLGGDVYAYVATAVRTWFAAQEVG